MELRPYEHWFSRVEDEDYYEDLENDKKDAKYLPHIGAGSLGLVGAAGGGKLGYWIGKGRLGGALAGAAIGAAGAGYGGYRLGKHSKNKVYKRAERDRRRYEESNEEDRKYLRKRRQEKAAEEREERRTRAQEAMGYNSFRW